MALYLRALIDDTLSALCYAGMLVAYPECHRRDQGLHRLHLTQPRGHLKPGQSSQHLVAPVQGGSERLPTSTPATFHEEISAFFASDTSAAASSSQGDDARSRLNLEDQDFQASGSSLRYVRPASLSRTLRPSNSAFNAETFFRGFERTMRAESVHRSFWERALLSCFADDDEAEYWSAFIEKQSTLGKLQQPTWTAVKDHCMMHYCPRKQSNATTDRFMALRCPADANIRVYNNRFSAYAADVRPVPIPLDLSTTYRQYMASLPSSLRTRVQTELKFRITRDRSLEENTIPSIRSAEPLQCCTRACLD